MQRLLLSLLLIVLVPSALAQRYALVIGNSNYGADIGALKNPINDAKDMSALLRKKDFKVTTLTNANQRQMEQGIAQFTKQLNEKNAVGLFFYAGHGIEVGGRNYLIPLNANINGEGDVKYEAVDAGRVMSGMEYAGNNLNMVILDACRNNPFARSFRSASRGLAEMNPPKGSLILYATSPGDVAADGSGRNGLFTQHLLKAMDTPGFTVEKVFKITANKVYKSTNKKQLPWQSGVMLGDFYFTVTAPQAKTVTITAPAVNIDQAEMLFWESIKNETSSDYFESYLEEYPTGKFARLAKLKIRRAGNAVVVEPQQQTTEEKYSLTINTSPDNAKIRIINIGPRYQQGMKLKPGQYNIEVTHAGYQRHTEWIELGKGDKVQNVYLIPLYEETIKKRDFKVVNYDNGNRYEGQFKGGKKNGQGVFTFKNGNRHEGLYKDGVRSGPGVFTWKDGDRYEGMWKYDKMNGYGIKTYSGGNRYEGMWKDDKKIGQGVFIFKNGNRHEGMYKDGVRSAQGVFTWKNGDRYEGMWKNDKMNGYGVKNYSSGNRYEGMWKDDKKIGHGVFVFKNGNRHEGLYKDGVRSGQGVFTWKNGSRYEGMWKNDKRNGYGIKTYSDGRRDQGIWKDGKLVN